MSHSFVLRRGWLWLVLVCGGWIAQPTAAENWPQWRGPRGNGVCDEKNVPTRWSKSENVAWRLPLPGQAGATPVIWENRIFLTSADGKDLVLMCVGTDGKEQWRKVVSSGNREVRKDDGVSAEGNSASPSPSTDGKHVWTFMATGDLACFDLDGNEAWKVSLPERYGKFDIQFGMTSTPLLDGDRLYLQLLHTKAALVIALDKATGKEIWKQERKSAARAECLHSYASPVMYADGERKYLITHGADLAVAHALEDGKELWRVGGLNPEGKYRPDLRFVASPATAPGFIVVPSAKNGPVVCVKPDAAGDVTTNKDAQHWKRENNTPDVPSPLIVDGLVYLCRENGVLICLDAATGKVHYEQRVHNERHRASPVYADGKIYLTARDGQVNVVKAGPSYQLLATNDTGETTSASPVISNGRLYLRSFESLICVEP